MTARRLRGAPRSGAGAAEPVRARERVAAVAVERRSELAARAVLALVALIASVSVLAGGGSGDGRLVWIGGAALVAAGAASLAIAAGTLPRVPLGRAGRALAVLLVAWAAWTGATIAWSIQPDRSWSVFNRSLTYVALFALGAVAAATARRAPRLAAAALACLVGAAVLWALAGKVVPALGPDVERSARLHAPVEYWNALALLIAMSLPAWLWIAAAPGRRPHLRAGACVALSLSLVALALTGSRGGIAVAALAVGTWLALAAPRLESATALAVAGLPAVAAAVWALSRPGIAEAGVPESDRVDDGALLLVALAVAATFVFLAAFALARAGERRPPSPRARRLAGQAAVALALAVAAGVLVAAVVRVGNPVAWVDARLDEFRNPPSVQVEQGPGRFADVSSNNRWIWWTEAWTLFRGRPLGGSGAGTFALARKPIREGTHSPLDPHNLGLRALSETGLVGFLLLAATVAAAAAVAAGALRRLRGGDRLATAALVAAAVAYLAHSLVDMGFEFVAVSAPLFVILGVLAGAGRAPGARRGSLLPGLAAAVIVLTAVASLATPRLAERRLDDAVDSFAARDVTGAARLAREAQALNPLSIAPLHIEAAAQQALGRLDEAERLYVEAVELQPENPATWYELGRFQLQVRRDPAAALRYLDRSWALDAFGPAGPLLDEAREQLAARGG